LTIIDFDRDADDRDRGVVFEIGFGAVLAGLFLVRCGHVAALVAGVTDRSAGGPGEGG
jgi:hypothetical protein